MINTEDLAEADRIMDLIRPFWRLSPTGIEYRDDIASALASARTAAAESAAAEATLEGRDAGVTFVFEQLADMLGATGWSIQDGTETWDGDVLATLNDILIKGGVVDADSGKLIRTAAAEDMRERAARLVEDRGASDAGPIHPASIADAAAIRALPVGGE